jgi:hypothetical protein
MAEVCIGGLLFPNPARGRGVHGGGGLEGGTAEALVEEGTVALVEEGTSALVEEGTAALVEQGTAALVEQGTAALVE